VVLTSNAFTLLNGLRRAHTLSVLIPLLVGHEFTAEDWGVHGLGLSPGRVAQQQDSNSSRNGNGPPVHTIFLSFVNEASNLKATEGGRCTSSSDLNFMRRRLVLNGS
jgi:hypothetical protein